MPRSTDRVEVEDGGTLTSAISEIMKMTEDAALSEAGHPMPRMVDEEVELELANQLNLVYKKGDFKNKTPYLESRSLHLEFSKKLHSPALTGTPLRGEGSTSIQVGLVDLLTGEIVSSGPESSAEVEIVLLSPDFAVSNWTTEDFNDNIVRGNFGKRLLTGDVRLNLKAGVGLLHNVYFTHTKCWRAKCEFRLGARVLDPIGIRIREAKTEPFGVEDRRGQLNAKHFPPLLSDHVWRLKCIMKNGAYHKRLDKEGIITVKDLWTVLNTNQQKLQTILTGISARMWEELVDHLRTCILDTKLNLYWCSDNQNGVVFNVVCQILGIFENRQYILIQNLSETQKDLAINLVAFALTHLAEVTTFDNEASLFDSLSCFSTLDEPFVAPELSFDEIHFPGTENSDLIIVDEIQNQPSPIYDHIVTHDDYQLVPHDPVYSENDINGFSFWDNPDNNDDEMYNRHMDFPSPATYSIICEAKEMVQAYNNDHEFEDTNVRMTSSQKKSFSNRRAQTRWRKLSNVLKFVSVRQDVAKKGKPENNYSKNNNKNQICSSFHKRIALYEAIRSRAAAAGLKGQMKQCSSKGDSAKSRWRVLSSVMKLCSVKNPVPRKPVNFSPNFGDDYSMGGMKSLDDYDYDDYDDDDDHFCFNEVGR